MKIKPDYEVTAQLVTFRGETRTDALTKLCQWMDENKVPAWEDEFQAIDTGWTTDNGHYASAMARVVHKKLDNICPLK